MNELLAVRTAQTMKNSNRLLSVVPAFALAGLLAAGSGALLSKSGNAGASPEKGAALQLSNAFREVARTIGPSVVSIVAIRNPEAGAVTGPFQDEASPLEDPLFRRFFGEQFQYQFPQFPEDHPFLRGQGSGVIVGEDGTIVTNNHVVAGAERFEVILADGRKFPAELVGADPETDLALLQVDAKGLPAAQLGNSDALEPGDWVVAVGNPFGLDHTVTVGVVSAKERSGVGLATYENFIQTDAAINPGNSGGPLVDLDGRVVGINTAIRSHSGGSDGIGFAIPSSTLESVLPNLKDDGKVERGWLGVSIQNLTDELARSFGRDSRDGALISEVIAGTPAEEAGLAPGDIVVAIDGESVESSIEFRRRIAALEPGTRVSLDLIRGGERRDVDVELDRRPAQGEMIAHGEKPSLAPTQWGIRFQEVPAELARRLDVEGGALVASVVPGSPADLGNLSRGDVILAIDDHVIAGPEEALASLRKADASEGVRMRVRSQNGTHYVFLRGSAKDAAKD